MNDKATFLQGLLERVRRNAAKPRSPRAAATPPATSVSPAIPVPVVAAPQPAPRPPPPRVAPPPETQPIAPAQATYHVPAAPPVTEIPVEEADGTVEVMELDEAEIVDITLEDEIEAPAAQAPASAVEAPDRVAAKPPAPVATDIDFEDEDDRPPSSSRRPILAASSLDEALAGAVDEHEVPIKTPPPESGPQEALPPAQVLQQKPLELDEPGMEAELARSGPAPEQVGNTIELDEPAGPALELDSLPAESGPQPGRAKEELEAELRPTASDRAASRPTPTIEKGPESDAPELTSAVVPVSPPIPAGAEPHRVNQLIPPATARVEPEITPRSLPPSDVPVAAFAHSHREFKPATFLELLDASLKLGG